MQLSMIEQYPIFLFDIPYRQYYFLYSASEHREIFRGISAIGFREQRFNFAISGVPEKRGRSTGRVSKGKL